MKHLIALICFAALVSFTGCSTTASRNVTAQKQSEKPVKPWSVIGAWHATYPAWTQATFTLADDGSFSFNSHVAGHWTLTSIQGEVMLVLAWNRWPTQTIVMVSPDEFAGKDYSGELRLTRIGAALSAESNPVKTNR